MGRKKAQTPVYGYHISGQARAVFAGVQFYLGKHGSPESFARYSALLAEYQTNGFKPPGQPTHQIDERITIRCVTADFRQRVLPRYEGNSGDHNRFDNLLKLLDCKYGDSPADEFGPRKLESLRDGFISKGNCRRYANQQTRNVVRIIKHGVSRELVPSSVLTGLEALEPLRRGDARDNPRRQPVPREDVMATIAEVAPVVADMLMIQLGTGCRPGELFGLTPSAIDRSGDAWMIRPSEHKTAHHGKRRSIPLVGAARESAARYLFGDQDDLCFRNRRGNRWTAGAYRQHITKAAKRANVDHWSPYLIRHLVGQEVRDAAGIESVQAVLGHARAATSEIYSDVQESVAVAALHKIAR